MHIDSFQLTPVRLPIDGAVLDADLGLPESPRGIVVFAHGSGSSRYSPRNQFVAAQLRARGFGTLLADLLTGPEEALDRRTARLRFDVGMLGHRVVALVDWLRGRTSVATLPIGLFGASTGAAAALIAAAERPEDVAAVVSRGGRPDLADAALPGVRAPTLLLVGGLDTTVIDMNRDAQRRMRHIVQLEIIPGASHLFEEPGTLELVARHAGEWFERYLPARAAAPAPVADFPRF
ncbi:MAG: dienelactone hydrolase family protein [Vicinamibacterales bacterium]